MDLQTDLRTLGLPYKLQFKKLSKLGINTVKDFLYHIPSRYEDLRVISRIKGLRLGEIVTVKGNVTELKNEYRARRFSMQKIIIEDETGSIECRWFNQPYLIKSLAEGSILSVSGSVEFYGKVKCIAVKEFEVLNLPGQETVHTGRLVPVYKLTRGLSAKWIRTKVFDILNNQGPNLDEFLPENLLLTHHLPELKQAISSIHFPASFDEVAAAHNRLSYEELFLVQLGALIRRQSWEKKNKAPQFQILKYKDKIDKLISSLPFTLTHAQIRSLDEIYADMATNVPMNRLLEGDVGSGKTVVATIALYVAYLNGFQGIIMAPTEILANQHYDTISKLLEPVGLKVALVTGSSKINILPSTFDILVGTHALLNQKIKLDNLGLVVIDEQQRFGVEQRAVLKEKGKSPHFLTMTATPIPRTVFLTLYGDLSLSVLDEMPKGRIKVKTWLVPESKRPAGYEWIKKKINEKNTEGIGNQVFIVCPFIFESTKKQDGEIFGSSRLIEESESAVTVKAATKEFETLSKKVFKGYKLGLLHGKMKVKEKNEVLEKFAKGKIDVLVATPVVEVGIDIPNATIMVIEASERFGLASLHQLRGRVGRRERESYCLLFTDSDNSQTRERLRSLETIYIGAELAELDLKLRGPGDMYGTEQHGGHHLKIASLSDFPLILKTKKDADKIFEQLKSYPELEKRVELEADRPIHPD